MQNEGRIISPISQKVELKIVALLIRDITFIAKVIHVLDSRPFHKRYHALVDSVKDTYLSTKTLLDKTALLHKTKERPGLVNLLFRIRIGKLNSDFYMEQYQKMAKSVYLQDFVEKTAEILDNGSEIDYNDLVSEIRGISDVSVVDEFSAPYNKITARMKSYLEGNERKKIRTSFPTIDRALKGGLEVGELCTILGLPNSGKSQILINIGAFGIIKGLHVFHLTLEMAKHRVEARYDSRLSNIPVGSLGKNTLALRQRIRQALAMNKGKLYVHQSISRMSVDSLRSLLRVYIERYGKPDILMVDMAIHLKSVSSSKNNEKRHDLSEILTELRLLGMEFGIGIFTPHPANRMGHDDELLDLNHIGEAYAVAFIADIVIALCKTRDEHKAKKCRLHLAKVREGESGLVIPCRFDFRRSYIGEG